MSLNVDKWNPSLALSHSHSTPVPEEKPEIQGIFSKAKEALSRAFDAVVVPKSFTRASGMGTFFMSRALQRGADINERNEFGQTALLRACKEENLEKVELLLERGASSDIKDHRENSPLNIAIFAKNPQLIKMLIKYGADPHLLNKNLVSSALSVHANSFYHLEENRFILDLLPLTEFDRKFIATNIYAHVYSCEGSFSVENQSISVEGSVPLIMRQFFSEALEEFENTLKDDDHGQVEEISKIKVAFRLSTNPNVTNRELVERIRKGELTFIQAGWKGHAVEIVFHKGYMAICNRGARDQLNGSLDVYKISPNEMTEQTLNKIYETKSLKRTSGIEFHYSDLPNLLDGKRDAVTRAFSEIEPKNQKVGNCSLASPKAALRFAWVMERLEVAEQPESLTFKEQIYRFFHPQKEQIASEQKAQMQDVKKETKIFSKFLTSFVEEKYRKDVFPNFFCDTNYFRIQHKKSKMLHS